MNKKHVLTVDDESEVRALLAEALGGAGYRVTGAASAGEARALLRAGRPDLIVTDLQMEDTDGYDFIDEIHALYPDLPIVLLTGVMFDPGVIDKAVAGKIAAYVDKTASLERILAEVRRLAKP